MAAGAGARGPASASALAAQIQQRLAAANMQAKINAAYGRVGATASPVGDASAVPPVKKVGFGGFWGVLTDVGVLNLGP